MQVITKNTTLVFTEVKRGHATGKSYELSAQEFIDIVKNKDCDGNLNVGAEAILDEDGEVIDFTADKFYDLPITEQLDMCCRREGDSYASDVTYEVA